MTCFASLCLLRAIKKYIVMEKVTARATSKMKVWVRTIRLIRRAKIKDAKTKTFRN